jgi:chromosome segregation ATPase
MRENRTLERELQEFRNNSSEDLDPGAASEISKLKDCLRKTKALLADSQAALEHLRNESAMPSKSVLRQLKNRVDDVTHARDAAVRARLGMESDLKELQAQLEDALRSKSELEQRVANLQREKHSLVSRVSEQEDELEDVSPDLKSMGLRCLPGATSMVGSARFYSKLLNFLEAAVNEVARSNLKLLISL